ncbi:sensor histidine kinase [Sediminitomix flava]|uniref:histidine kinase n=1 Tax=Sediminitomix flava TaxID=379075 RepID=A0A315Z8A4_SEDFL|nr:PAS domain-containing sensor histidine kinase [Sediminitomix flava]PWJ39266.1 phospho-acceptor domain-containing protein [Sediminitomix flava]
MFVGISTIYLKVELSTLNTLIIIFQCVSFVLLFSEYTFRIGLYTLWFIPLFSFIYSWSGIVGSIQGGVASMIVSLIALIFIIRNRTQKLFVVAGLITYLIIAVALNNVFMLTAMTTAGGIFEILKFVLIFLVMTHIGVLLVYITNQIDSQSEKINENNKQLYIQTTKYEQLIKSIKEDYFLFSENTDGKLSYVSPSYFTVLGYDEVKTMDEIISEDEEVLRWIHTRNRLLKGTTDTVTLNFKVKSQKNEKGVSVLKVQQNVRKGINGEILGIDGIAQDITERLTYQTHLVEALAKEKQLNALKTNLISTVSHQFRTPLTVIQSSTELLQLYMRKQEIESPKTQKLTNRVVDTVLYMNEMVDDILFFRSLEENPQLEPQCTEQSFSVFITNLVTKYNPLIKGDKTILLDQIGEEKTFSFDEKIMGHVFGNLLSNAIKYTPPHCASPKIKVEYHTNYLNAFIIDHGIGINKEDITKLFTPFFRGENTKNYKGTGLGLVIAKEYLQSHRGAIRVESVEGEGTTFKIRLPYQRG